MEQLLISEHYLLKKNFYWNLRVLPSYGFSLMVWFDFMVFNATFNNISVISWRSALLVEETTDLMQVTDKLYHIMLNTSPCVGFVLTTLVVIGTDCIGSCKSKCHTIMTTTASFSLIKMLDKRIMLKFVHTILCIMFVKYVNCINTWRYVS
jgi:hypothetical protein